MTEPPEPPPAVRQVLVVPRESRPGERRVAVTPETAATLAGQGLRVVVEPGAGRYALCTDEAYRAAGAEVRPVVLSEADIVCHVRPLTAAQIAELRPGTVTVGFATGELDGIRVLRDQHVTALAMELIPRISRAQSMDALTSQALVSGYRCVLEAAVRLPRFFPLFMTAAGTVPPARTLVLGAGVAGLQAIATAKRLGAIVSAYDVRSSSADEVRSMGGTFIDLGLDTAEGAGGYAAELNADRARRQQEALTPHIATSDVVITTAAVPGRPAPRLVTRAMVTQMAPGSVVVDLAAESGGNVEGSVPGEDVAMEGVQVVGMRDAASSLPVDASRLYAKNLANLLRLGVREGRFVLDGDDEVLAGATLTSAGQVRHAGIAAQLDTAVEGTR